MNGFIVHAHPNPQSFCASMCSTAMEHLRALGHEVRVSDVYATNFNPVASAADFSQCKNADCLVCAMEQRHGHETDRLACDIQAELGKLLWCDLLILNFPIFWFSTLAMLKGWIDRVLVSGLVYGGKRFYDQGGLAGKKAMLSITMWDNSLTCSLSMGSTARLKTCCAHCSGERSRTQECRSCRRLLPGTPRMPQRDARADHAGLSEVARAAHDAAAASDA